MMEWEKNIIFLYIIMSIQPNLYIFLLIFLNFKINNYINF